MLEKTLLGGFVQAGGGSRRFGADKALCLLGGRTMLDRTTELVRLTCGTVRIIAGRGKYPEAPAKVLADRWPGEGPLGGILTALGESPDRSTKSEWNLIVGCDMPFLTREWLQYLCERAAASRAEVVLPESEFGWEPCVPAGTCEHVWNCKRLSLEECAK